MIDIQSAAAEIRRGKKKKKDIKKPQGKNIMSASATQGGHNDQTNYQNYYTVRTLLFETHGSRELGYFTRNIRSKSKQKYLTGI